MANEHQSESAAEILKSLRVLVREDSEAFGWLVLAIFRELATVDKQAYDALLCGAIASTFHRDGLFVAIEKAKQSLALGDAAGVEEQLRGIESVVRAIERIGSRQYRESLVRELNLAMAEPASARVM